MRHHSQDALGAEVKKAVGDTDMPTSLYHEYDWMIIRASTATAIRVPVLIPFWLFKGSLED